MSGEEVGGLTRAGLVTQFIASNHQMTAVHRRNPLFGPVIKQAKTIGDAARQQQDRAREQKPAAFEKGAHDANLLRNRSTVEKGSGRMAGHMNLFRGHALKATAY